LGEICNVFWVKNTRPTIGRVHFLFACLSLVRKTITAINGTITSRLEGNLAAPAAVSANRVKHFALAFATAAASVVLRDVTARLAPYRLVREAFFRKEILLTCRKHEFFPAVPADDCFVLMDQSKYLL